MPEKGNDARQTALALGSAGVASSASLGAAEVLNRALTKGPLGRHVPEEVLHRLSEVMKFPSHLPEVIDMPVGSLSWEGVGGDRPVGRLGRVARGWIEIPGLEEKGGAPLAGAAHEMGHAKGGVIQRVTGALSDALFVKPKTVSVGGRSFVTPSVSPLHIPLLAAAVTSKSDDKTIRWIQEHPAEIAAGMAAIPLAQEAHASVRALDAIRKLPITSGGGRAGMVQAAGPLIRGLGSHALTHLPAIAALLAASKVRDLIQGRREAAMEKAGSYDPLTGGYLMDVSQVFMDSFADTLNKLAQEEVEESEEEKKKKEEERKKREEEEKKKEEEGGEGTKEAGLLSNFRRSLGLDKTASAISGLREKLGLSKHASARTEPAGAFEAWKSTL